MDGPCGHPPDAAEPQVMHYLCWWLLSIRLYLVIYAAYVYIFIFIARENQKMFKIALVQNQSEMAHYAYADCRSLFRDLGYEVNLYTAQNIDQLPQAILTSRVDAIVFGSNALNDQTIREEIYKNEFKLHLSTHLKKGGGLLILLQLRVAQQFRKNDTLGELSFLPTQHAVSLKARPDNEKSESGRLKEPIRRQRHSSLIYPHDVNLEQIREKAINGPSLRGLYWHYIDSLNEGEWDCVFFDESESLEIRPLLAISKETENLRIAICPLPLDWQRHRELLANLLTYVTQGEHRTAIFGGGDIKSNPAFAYLTETLKAKKFPFRLYTDDEYKEAQKSISNGAHSLVILAQDKKINSIPKDLKEVIKKEQEAGNLGVIGIEQAEDMQKIYFSGKDYQSRQQLETLLIHYSEDLEKGYVDGSFFSTIESLQIIKRLDWPSAAELLKLPTLATIQREIKNHDRDGSYDEVYHPSCALLWFKSLCLGVESHETQKTAAWVRTNSIDHQAREKTLGLYSLYSAGCISELEREDLIKMIYSQIDNPNLTELDLIFFLEIAVELNISQVASQVMASLIRMQDPISGVWIDLPTTATAVYWILAARALPDIQKSSNDLLPIYKSLSYIHLARSVETNPRGYHWDKKAATSLRCLAALAQFEKTLDMPIGQFVAMIFTLTAEMAIKKTTTEALDVVQRLKEDNVSLMAELQKSFENINQIKNEQQSLNDIHQAQMSDATARIAKLQKTSNKQLFITYIEIGIFWFLIPFLLAGTISILIYTLKYFAAKIPNLSPAGGFIVILLETGWLGFMSFFTPLLATIIYFARKKLPAELKND